MGASMSNEDAVPVPKKVVAVVSANADPADFKKAMHAVFSSSGSQGNNDMVDLAKVMKWITKYYSARKADANKKELPGMGILNKAMVKYGSAEALSAAIDASGSGDGKVSESVFMHFFAEEATGCPGAMLEAVDIVFFLKDPANIGEVDQEDIKDALEDSKNVQALMEADGRSNVGGKSDSGLIDILDEGGMDSIKKEDFIQLYLLRRAGLREAFKTRFDALAGKEASKKLKGGVFMQAILDFPSSFGVKEGEKPKLVRFLSKLPADEEIDYAAFTKFMEEAHTKAQEKAQEDAAKNLEQAEANPKLLEVQRLWAALDSKGEGKVPRKEFKEALEKQKTMYTEYKVPKSEGCANVALTALSTVPNGADLEWTKFRPAFDKKNK